MKHFSKTTHCSGQPAPSVRHSDRGEGVKLDVRLPIL